MCMWNILAPIDPNTDDPKPFFPFLSEILYLLSSLSCQTVVGKRVRGSTTLVDCAYHTIIAEKPAKQTLGEGTEGASRTLELLHLVALGVEPRVLVTPRQRAHGLPPCRQRMILAAVIKAGRSWLDAPWQHASRCRSRRRRERSATAGESSCLARVLRLLRMLHATEVVPLPGSGVYRAQLHAPVQVTLTRLHEKREHDPAGCRRCWSRRRWYRLRGSGDHDAACRPSPCRATRRRLRRWVGRGAARSNAVCGGSCCTRTMGLTNVVDKPSLGIHRARARAAAVFTTRQEGAEAAGGCPQARMVCRCRGGAHLRWCIE